MPIRFHNTLTRKVEEFAPSTPGAVRMYNCGPTVYSSPHIGNFRTFLLSDLLRRFFEWKGLKVTQVMNLTDVGHLLEDAEEGEDKLEAAAKKEKVRAIDIAQRYTDEFFAALDYLGFRKAHHYPKATEHIPEMIAMIETLVAKGVAYAVPSGNVYFDIAKFPAYGRLSGNTAEHLEAGARIEVNPEKRDPRDFALWKVDPRHQMQWDSPWGRGFPGWHIECSAMSKKYLGETLDVHTGGEDNVFPHHECEIAQSEAANGKPFVRHWLHARHLLVDNTKMSKRLGNVHTIEGLKKQGASSDAIRIALQKSHYREPLNFTLAGLEEAEKKVARYRNVASRLLAAASNKPVSPGVEALVGSLRTKFEAALDDDLNASVAFAVLDEAVAEANRREPTGGDARRWRELLQEMWGVFGLLETRGEQEARTAGAGASGAVIVGSADLTLEPAVLELARARWQARAKKDFAAADRVRGELATLGFREVKDAKSGMTLVRAEGTITIPASMLDA
jgi:cysteinyl-tRNA synthetase